jgi:flagellar export protein FliJ
VATSLEREIKTEQDRAGITIGPFRLPNPIRRLRSRVGKPLRSADELKVQLDDAKGALGEAFEELKKVELLDERDHARERAAENAVEQSDLDAIGLMRARNTAPA